MPKTTKRNIKKRQKVKTIWYLDVFYTGFNQDLDDHIRKALRKKSTGSGYDFSSRTRDMEFPFRTKRSASAAATCLERKFGKPNTPRVWSSVRQD